MRLARPRRLRIERPGNDVLERGPDRFDAFVVNLLPAADPLDGLETLQVLFEFRRDGRIAKKGGLFGGGLIGRAELLGEMLLKRSG